MIQHQDTFLISKGQHLDNGAHYRGPCPLTTTFGSAFVGASSTLCSYSPTLRIFSPPIGEDIDYLPINTHILDLTDAPAITHYLRLPLNMETILQEASLLAQQGFLSKYSVDRLEI